MWRWETVTNWKPRKSNRVLASFKNGFSDKTVTLPWFSKLCRIRKMLKTTFEGKKPKLPNRLPISVPGPPRDTRVTRLVYSALNIVRLSNNKSRLMWSVEHSETVIIANTIEWNTHLTLKYWGNVRIRTQKNNTCMLLVLTTITGDKGIDEITLNGFYCIINVRYYYYYYY